jgi:hypothetical protein
MMEVIRQDRKTSSIKLKKFHFSIVLASRLSNQCNFYLVAGLRCICETKGKTINFLWETCKALLTFDFLIIIINIVVFFFVHENGQEVFFFG